MWSVESEVGFDVLSDLTKFVVEYGIQCWYLLVKYPQNSSESGVYAQNQGVEEFLFFVVWLKSVGLLSVGSDPVEEVVEDSKQVSV